MNTNQFLKITKKELAEGVLEIRPKVICQDGFMVSIQASSMYCCSPRNDTADEYETVELGYPTKVESLIIQYAKCIEDPTGTVYLNVPVEVVDELLKQHGGILGVLTRISD